MTDLHSHIPDEEILQDIADTKADIARWTTEAEHLEKTPTSMQNARIDHIRASARRTWIKEGHEFIAKLEEILKQRHEENN